MIQSYGMNITMKNHQLEEYVFFDFCPTTFSKSKTWVRCHEYGGASVTSMLHVVILCSNMLFRFTLLSGKMDELTMINMFQVGLKTIQ